MLLGTRFLKARCLATPVMVLSFHMVHFMQAVAEGKVSFCMAAIRQLCLNIPMLLLLNHLLGMNGIVWAQLLADTLNVTVSYLIFWRMRDRLQMTPPRVLERRTQKAAKKP
ncbi:MAG: hypothetical protein IJP03_00745 [Christensenellaceae bacterium]|nr:hypothetical protein [Christensenellaceae bacterium]